MIQGNVIQGSVAIVSDPTPQNYVAYYPLTGTAEDVTGSYNGTENGGLTYVNDASRGAVSNFDGVNDYIEAPFLGADNGVSVSWSVWAKSSTVSDYNMILDNRQGDYEGTVLYIQPDAKVQFSHELASGAVGFNFVSVETLSNNTWYNLCGTYDGSTVKLYINGIEATNSVSSPGVGMTGNQANLRIGNWRQADLSLGMNGAISNARIYDRTLTPEEVTSIYNYELVTHHIPVDNGLVAYYPLKTNSMDNYYNQYDGVDTNVTYNSVEATIIGSINFGSATGFTNGYAIHNGVSIETVTETDFNTLTGTLSNVRKYSRALSVEEKTQAGY